MNLNVLQVFSEGLLIAVCLSTAHGKKVSINFYVALFLTFYTITGETIYRFGLPAYLTLLVYLFVWIYSIIIYKDSMGKAAIYLVLTTILVSVLQIIPYAFVYLIFYNINYTIIGIRGTITNFLAMLLILIFEKRLKLGQIVIIIAKKVDEIKIVLIMILVAIACVIIAFRNTNFIDNKLLIAMIIFLVAVCIAISKWDRVCNEAEKEKLKNEMYESYNSAFEELVKGIRDRQHEFTNHINAMYGLHATANSLDELIEGQREYSKYVTTENRYNKLLRNAECPVFIGFLYMKFASAEQKGVDVQYNVAMDKFSSTVPVYDMIEMVGILLDNAVEAVLLDEIEKRRLYAKIYGDDKEIYIRIENPYKYMKSNEFEQLFISGYSTKENNRGLGLAKLKRITDKYHIEILVENMEQQNTNVICFELKIEK